MPCCSGHQGCSGDGRAVVTRHTHARASSPHTAKATLPSRLACFSAWAGERSRSAGSCACAGFALQLNTRFKSLSAPESAWERDAPQPPLLACVRQQPSVKSFRGCQARKWTVVASWQQLCCPGEVACLGMHECPCACSVDVVFVHVGRGVQGNVSPKQSLGCGLHRVRARACCLQESAPSVHCRYGGPPVHWVEQAGLPELGICGLGRAGQCLCAFVSMHVQVCVSVRCFCMVWSILGCSRTVRAACDAEVKQALWASLTF